MEGSTSKADRQLPTDPVIRGQADVTPENDRRSATDPMRTRLTIQEKAALVATLRFDSKTPSDGLDNQEFTEDLRGGYGVKFRTAVQDVLHRLEAPEFIARIEAQYDNALEVWTDKYPINVKDAPSKIDLTKWLSTLPPKTLCGLKTLGADALVLVPPMKVRQLIKIIDASRTLPEERSQIVSENNWPDFWNRVGTNKWKFGITNIKQEAGLTEFNLFEDGPIGDVIIDIYNPGHTTKEKIRAAMRANSPGEEFETMLDYALDELPLNPGQVVEGFIKIFARMGVSIMPAHGYVPAYATKSAREVTDQFADTCLDLCSDTLFNKPPGSKHRFPTAGGIMDESRINLGFVPDNLSDDTNDKYMSNYGCRPWVESGEN